MTTPRRPAPGLQRAGARLPIGEYTRRLWERRWFVAAYSNASNAVGYQGSFLGQAWQLLTPMLNILVYYLIFAAYILMTATFAPTAEWNNSSTGTVTSEQVQGAAIRVGGILLVIGILHGLNIVLMPVLGRLFSLNRSLSGAPRRDRSAEPVDLDR